jgi:hypothetical protein
MFRLGKGLEPEKSSEVGERAAMTIVTLERWFEEKMKA